MSPEPVDTANSPHYQWGGVSEGWRLLDLADMSVIQEKVPPGAGETTHVHARARQFFYILRGRAVIELPSGPVALSAGQGVHVEPGVPHRFANDSPDDVEFLVVSTPTTRGDRTDLPAGSWPNP